MDKTYSLKEELIDCILAAKKLEKKYIAVLVKAKDNKPEIIINPYGNIDFKLEYYKKSYNENLELLNAPFIKIIDFVYSDNLTDIERRFM